MHSFCEEMSMHGLAYVASARKPVALLWVTAVVSSFAIAIKFSKDNMVEWEKSPSAVTFMGMLPVEVGMRPLI